MTNQQQHPERDALWRAVDLVGGQSALARLLGTVQSSVSFWLLRAKKGVPGDVALQIQRITRGKVSRHDLRPDLYPPPRSRPDGNQRKSHPKRR